MAPTVQELINILQQIAPESLAENWDNVGLLVGEPSRKVNKILLALDPSPALITDAENRGCDLIITHHPAIFRPLKALRTDTPTGQFIYLALQKGISVIGCHTNLDAATGGVSDVLADGLGLTDTKPLVVSEQDCIPQKSCGLGRIGSYRTPVSPQDFIAKLLQTCAPPWLLEAGPRPQWIQTVAVCGGSCSDYAELAQAKRADVFVTAEIKHAVARWAEDTGFWIIDGGHFATENPAISVLQKRLQQQLQQTKLALTVTVANQHSPLRLVQESTSATLAQ